MSNFVFDPTAPVSSGTNYGQPFAGIHQARFMGAVMLGLQPRPSARFGDKPPAQKMTLFFELLDDQVELETGKVNRRFTTTVTCSMHEKATLRKIILALDPANQHGGDLVKMAGTPVSLILEAYTRQDGSQGVKFGGIAAVPPAQAGSFPPATLDPVFFTPQAPDPEVWKKLPRFCREQVVSALDFAQSVAGQQGYVADIPQEAAHIQQQPAPVPSIGGASPAPAAPAPAAPAVAPAAPAQPAAPAVEPAQGTAGVIPPPPPPPAPGQ